MTSRPSTIAALIMVGLALVATPILAADKIPGNHGSDLDTDLRQVTVVIPPYTPINMPTIDPSAVMRDIDVMSEDDMLLGLGTVTHHADGSVTTTPASDVIKAIVAAEYKTR